MQKTSDAVSTLAKLDESRQLHDIWGDKSAWSHPFCEVCSVETTADEGGNCELCGTHLEGDVMNAAAKRPIEPQNKYRQDLAAGRKNVSLNKHSYDMIDELGEAIKLKVGPSLTKTQIIQYALRATITSLTTTKG